MNRFVFVILGVVVAWSLTLGSHVKGQAEDVVLGANIATLSKALALYSVSNGEYPEYLSDLIKTEEVRSIEGDYVYSRSDDGLEASILGVNDKKFYCWNSEDGSIVEVESKITCSP